MHVLLLRERIEKKKQIPVWIFPCDFIVCSPNDNSIIYQRVSVASDLSRLLFSRRLPSVPHDRKKHQSKVSSRKPRRPPGHLFGTNAQTNIRGHETIPLVLQQETQNTQERRKTQGKRPTHQTMKLRQRAVNSEILFS